MTRNNRDNTRMAMPAGAILTLLALCLFAPASAQGACSHLVKSLEDRAHSQGIEFDLSSLVQNGDPMAAPDGSPTAPVHKPCSGAWCTEQPAIPSVPAGVFEGRIASWAWFHVFPCDRSDVGRFLTADATVCLPLSQVSTIFHPPRHIS
jgi:hypothetical protein